MNVHSSVMGDINVLDKLSDSKSLCLELSNIKLISFYAVSIKSLMSDLIFYLYFNLPRHHLKLFQNFEITKYISRLKFVLNVHWRYM